MIKKPRKLPGEQANCPIQERHVIDGGDGEQVIGCKAVEGALVVIRLHFRVSEGTSYLIASSIGYRDLQTIY